MTSHIFFLQFRAVALQSEHFMHERAVDTDLFMHYRNLLWSPSNKTRGGENTGCKDFISYAILNSDFIEISHI